MLADAEIEANILKDLDILTNSVKCHIIMKKL